MQYPKECKPWKAAAKDHGRYAMAHLQLSGIRRVDVGPDQTQPEFPYRGDLAATDGRILAVIQVDICSRGGPKDDTNDPDAPADTEGLVTAEALQRATKSATSRQPDAVIQCNGGLRTIDGTESRRPTDGEFPRWRAIVPEKEKLPQWVAFDASLLARLCSAIGTDKVRLRFDAAEKGTQRGPIYVEPLESGRYGVLMPLTVDA